MRKKMFRVVAVCLCLALTSAFAACAPSNLVYEEESQSQTLAVQAKDFYNFIFSREGQTVLSAEGLVPKQDLSTYPTYKTVKNTMGGKVTVIGSTSVQPAMNILVEEYNDKYQADVEIRVSGSGSGEGRTEAEKGNNATFGIVSSALSATQKEKLDEYPMGMDGVAVVVPKAMTSPEGLSKDQLVTMYTTEAEQNWKDFGGEDKGIVTYAREASSGTREAFEKPLGIEKTSKAMVELASTGTILQGVASSLSGIGYASLADIGNAAVRVLKIDGVECTTQSVKSGTYLFSRPFSLVLKKGMKVA